MANSDTAKRLARRERVWELRCEGYTQAEIAETVGTNQSTVSRDLRWWANQIIDEIKEQGVTMKVEQLGQLQYVVSEAMGSWRKSKQPDKTVTKTATNTSSETRGTDKSEQMRTQVREQAGDPRYLNVALKAMGDIRNIVGLDAPIRQQIELMGKDGEAVEINNNVTFDAALDDMSEAELRAFITAVERLEAAADSDDDE